MSNQIIQKSYFTPRKTLLSRAIATAIVTSSVPAVIAQQLEEIIVTATKRNESVQDVPLAVTAFTGDFTKRLNLNDVKDLVTFTPGVTGNSQDSFIDAISVRGIRTQDFGVGGDPSSAFFKNDLYEGRNGSAVTSLYDMERSEVLRGPQGFLFGRNSIAGAFSVHTNKAEIGGGQSGYINLDLAQRSHAVAEGAINIPVSDNFAMRLAGYHSTEDGFAYNTFNNTDLIEHDKSAIRWSTTYETDKLSIKTTAEYETRDQSGSVYRAADSGDVWETLQEALGDINLRGSDEDIDSDQSFGDNDNADILTLGMRLDYEFDFATLTSNTGYKDHDYFYQEDYDGTPLNINNFGLDQTGDYFQQELRLTSNSESALSWYAGVSYYKESLDALFTNEGEEDLFCQYYGNYYGYPNSGCVDYYGAGNFTPNPDGLLTETGRILGEYSGWAGYIDLNYAINDTLDIGVGIRYTKDDKEFSINVPTPNSDLGPYWAYGFSTDGFLTTTESWNDVSTRAIIRYRPNESAMVFASYTEGFKSGGFGSFNLDNNAAGDIALGNTDLTQADGFLPNLFNPEIVDSYEIGYKDTVFDDKAAISLTAFYYEYEDLQVVVTTEGGAAVVRNAGNVESLGVEGTITTIINDNFDLYMAVSWLDSEGTNLQDICGLDNANGCEGRRLFWAPEYTAALVLNGNFPLKNGSAITSNFELSWESERGGGWESLAETQIDASAEATLRIGYEPEDNWSANLYIENITDEFTWDGQNNGSGILPSHKFGPRRPRTVGININYEWQ